MRSITTVVLVASIGLAGAAPIAAVLPAQTLDSVWTIKSGSFAGQRISIHRSAASRRSSKFWRISDIAGQRRIVGWNPSMLPARVAFRHSRQISAADSASFWEILGRMEQDMGMQLFEPASLSPESDPADLIVVDTKSMTSVEGLTMVTWSSGGILYDARVYLRAPETLRNERVVTHEMMHALGFGHTASWPSVMNGYGGGVRGLTPDDVAYAQVALESRAAAEREDMWVRLALAADREPVPGESKGAPACPNESVASFVVDLTPRSHRLSNRESITGAMSCRNR